MKPILLKKKRSTNLPPPPPKSIPTPSKAITTTKSKPKNATPTHSNTKKRKRELSTSTTRKKSRNTNVQQQILDWNRQWKKSYPNNVHPFTRHRVVSKIYNTLTQFKQVDFGSVISVERIIYEITFPSAHMYRERVLHFLFNVGQNPKLLDVYTPREFIFLSNNLLITGTKLEQEMANYEEKMEQYNKLLSNKKIFGDDTIEEAIIVCRKPGCRSTDGQWDSIQNRGADEPATVFWTCSKCGEQRKMQ